MSDRVPCPLIVTHQCDDPPRDDHRWIAAFYVPTFTGSVERGDYRQVGWRRLPMVFNGLTKEQASDAAAVWWERQQDIRLMKIASTAKATARRHAKREASDA